MASAVWMQAFFCPLVRSQGGVSAPGVTLRVAISVDGCPIDVLCVTLAVITNMAYACQRLLSYVMSKNVVSSIRLHSPHVHFTHHQGTCVLL